MGYNPADYAAVENKAKAMSKPELENYYITDRDKKHKSPWDAFGVIIAVGIFIFLIGLIGAMFGSQGAYNQISDISDSIANQVCPVADDVYISVDIGKTDYYDFEIDCSTYHPR